MKKRQPNRPSDETIAACEARLGYVFSNKETLRIALTHKSAGDGMPGFVHNERLEWLGDRVLGLLTAEMLYAAWDKDDEGVLTQRFHRIVSGQNCAQAARQLEMAQFLTVSRSLNATQVAMNDSMLGDVYEALMGALYLDGGIEAARPLFDLALKIAGSDPGGNAKNRLQEWLQARGLAAPRYEVVARTGPDHAPVFTIAALAHGQRVEANGGSKQIGEQAAAQALLDLLR